AAVGQLDDLVVDAERVERRARVGELAPEARDALDVVRARGVARLRRLARRADLVRDLARAHAGEERGGLALLELHLVPPDLGLPADRAEVAERAGQGDELELAERQRDRRVHRSGIHLLALKYDTAMRAVLLVAALVACHGSKKNVPEEAGPDPTMP